MKLFQIYSSIVAEALLGEKRMEFSELDNHMLFEVAGNAIVLINANKIPENASTKEDVLNAVEGYAWISPTRDRKYYFPKQIAANKGYGLIMYELVMQYVFPKYLVSDRDWNVTSASQRMYDYFYQELNPAVEVVKLSKEDPEYVPCDNARYLSCKNTTPYEEKLYNSRLRMKPDNINLLIKNAQESQLDYNEVSKAADIFWQKMY